jgi:PKD repeat protein
VGKNLPQEHQAFAVCLNQAAVAPNAAVITASPISGQAPLAVSFSAAQSTGSSSTYSWDFGDSSTGQGVTVSHTYTDSGTYTVTLTEDGGASATQQIYVSKPASSAQPLNARATLRFASRTMNDDLQFTIHADGLKMSPTDARNALRNGTFTNMRFAINVGGSADGTTAATNVASVALKKNATATFKDTSVRPNPTITFRLTPQKGQVQVQLHNVFLEDIFNASGMTTSLSSNGRHAMPVEVESADTIYRAVFNLNYRALSRGRMGTAKFP